ncbi:hypothetical protein RO3G_04941 [Lichtheimia corymbifera JMRC:FSU:9682]|uniref:Uncharacterized protein n=1 Tax=Lichtheimia corymbifera JMRC:FSU:9682 TaxID=1263082 RepID=A0A068S2U4_9FUNG|nr:hypothetical protein RO3G_04941 [Lichtheimia corymbifera JMRC:FSU:9682]
MSEVKAQVEYREGSIVLDMEKTGASSTSNQSTAAVGAHGGQGAPVCNVPEHQRKFGNPLPIGMGAFAVGGFMVGLYNTGLVIHIPQAVMGVALGFSAMGQLICGIAELLLGNTFGGTSMLTYSGFWFSYGIMFSGGGGFFDTAMEAGMHELEMCLGLWQIAFSIPAAIFFVATFKQPWIVRFLLFLVFSAFFFGGLGAFTGVTGLTVAGGWFSFALALVAFYIMAALLFAEEKIMNLPMF